MASSLALRSLLSKSLRPNFRALATAPSVSRSFNTNAIRDYDDDERRLDVDRLSDRSFSRRGDFAPSSFSDVFDPFSPTRSLSQVLNLMDHFMDNPFLSTSRGMGTGIRRSWDVKETDDALHLRVDMPGLSKEDVKVSVEQNTLTIQGEEKNETEDEESRRRYSSRIDLPEKLYKTGEIKAEMNKGVLKIVVPKLKEEERTDVINVKVE
ncbi:hypothetical protein VitviT2T_024706 [Vitis vinifera]|uniref:23.6 kDa heat shock protein, mitochondrial n=2 Tax=Vitis vinifera TaxID=29760 RepID=A5AFX4_VITVI|eukprot:XP_002267332.1 PREDICTED: 23.6 kDa heat shock protein, mitochondrial [Vitis vinifera]